MEKYLSLPSSFGSVEQLLLHCVLGKSASRSDDLLDQRFLGCLCFAKSAFAEPGFLDFLPRQRTESEDTNAFRIHQFSNWLTNQ